MPRFLRGLMLAVLSVAVLAFAVWGCFALFYQFQGGELAKTAAVISWGIVSAFSLWALFRWRSVKGFVAYLALLGLLLFWWSTILPSNSRDFSDDVARTVTGTIEENRATLVGVRNFDWRSETDYTSRWETRTYDLDKLASVDLILSYWGMPAIAHTLVSFGFKDGSFVTFSVEIRKERQEAFSEIGGFFKTFETSIIAADERDIVRLRTTVRKEDVHLFRVAMPQPAIRSLFLAYVDQANSVAATPRFYNTVTANCTTVVYAMVDRIVPGLPLDYRLLLSGYLPEYIADVGGFTPGYSAPQLREAGAISAKGQQADRDPSFSKLIRLGVPGIAPDG